MKMLVSWIAIAIYILVTFSVIAVSSNISSRVQQFRNVTLVRRKRDIMMYQPLKKVKFEQMPPAPTAEEISEIKKNAEKEIKEYYKCLRRRKKEYMDGRNIGQLVRYVTGFSVILRCNLCLLPGTPLSTYDIRWRVQKENGGVEYAVVIDGEKFVTELGKADLTVQDARKEDNGRYTCFRNDIAESVYELEVAEDEVRNPVSEDDLDMPAPQPLKSVLGGLELLTEWREWSECSQCDGNGTRSRIGICYVKPKGSGGNFAKELDVFNHYTTGIPCRSVRLPEAVSSLPTVGARASETQFEKCDIPCPTLPPPRVVTDSDGNSYTVQDELGWRPIHEGKPTLPPLHLEKGIFEPIENKVVIACPTTKAAVIAIRWERGSMLLQQRRLKEMSQGRVRIDDNNRLIFESLEKEDKGIYTCLYQDKIIATFKLNPLEKVEKLNVGDYVTLAGVGLVAFCTLCMGCRMLTFSKSEQLM